MTKKDQLVPIISFFKELKAKVKTVLQFLTLIFLN